MRADTPTARRPAPRRPRRPEGGPFRHYNRKKGVVAVPFAYLAPSDRSPINLFSTADYERQRAFFAARPELKATPLRRLRGLARALGLGEIRAKDETRRFGLNAFKAAGVIFAVTTLRERGVLAAGETLVCASEGNHGRAVARAAREAGCQARVYLAKSVTPARVAAVEGEGATVVAVPGNYDDAVRAMAADARANGWRVISDTALPGDDDEIPRLIMLGYTRLMDEAEAAWQPGPPPDVIYVPGGVGGLLGAVASWTAWRFPRERPAIVCVEPTSAACLQMSARDGRPTTLHGPFETVMAGLRCGEVSRAAFAAVHSIVDAYIAIDDQAAYNAIRRLAAPIGGDPEIKAGASGAAALGGLLTTLHDPASAELKRRLQLGPGSRVLVLVTEGVTDPDVFAQASGRPRIEHSAPPGGEPS